MKKVTIIAIVAVVVVLIAAVALMGESDPDKNKVQYDYTVEIADSFTTKTGYVETAGEGQTYAIVHIYAKNVGYDDGFSTNELIWQWKATVDAVSYSSSIDGFVHPDYSSSVTLEVGGEFRSVVVFKVPAGTTVEDVTISADKYLSSSYDDPVFEKVDVL